jgi:hypothetical protein
MKRFAVIASAFWLLTACGQLSLLPMPSASPPAPMPAADGPPTAEEYASFYTFEKIDANRNGMIELEEFMDANSTWILDNPEADRRDFYAHDTDRSNTLNRYEHSIWYTKQISTYR